MVVFDNSIFCLALHPDARPRSGVERAKDRVEYLLQTLHEEKEIIIIPTPALSEFLVFAGAEAPEYLIKIRESSVLRVEPFDERAAIELADMEISARSKGNKRGSAAGSEWQKVKIDRQIVAVARANGATKVYTDDPDVVAHCKDCGVEAVTSADLPLPPAKQMTLEEQLNESDQRATNETDQPAPVEVRGSDDGRAEDQAGAKAAEEGKAGKAEGADGT